MSSPISGFTAIPNPQMLAFMPIQSYLMMYFAGAGWQIGKRKISAIPNEEFNKMSAKDLLEGFTADLRSTIPTLERSLNDITPLIKTLIEQYGDFIRVAIETIPQLAQNIVSGQAGKNLSGNLQGGQDILAWISQQLPNIPRAEGRMLRPPAESRNAGGTDQIELESPSGIKIPTSFRKPFQGPEIIPRTGETTPFVKAVKNLPPPAPHIKSRPSSNVSSQSLKIERARLEQAIRRLTMLIAQDIRNNDKSLPAHRRSLGIAQQKLADFLKMHGARF